MKNFFYILLFICCALLPNKVHSQCNITKEENQSYSVFKAELERIYENEDLENGLKLYSIQTYMVLSKKDTSVEFKIRFLAASSLDKEVVIPRKIKIISKDNKQITIVASEYKNTNLNNSNGHILTFTLTLSDAAFIRTKELLYIEVSDNRTNKSELIPIKYSSLLIEQMDCLLK
jgi:hypothetical protein